MGKVTIVPNETTKQVVTAYKAKPGQTKQFGFIVVQSEETTVSDGWIRNKKRSALIRDEIAGLNKFIDMFAKNGSTLPGKIVVKEYLESEKEKFERFLNKELDYEEAVQQFLKTTGKDGIALTLGGERIIRISNYSLNENEPDILIEHDNREEVAEWRKANKVAKESGEANLDS